MTRADLIAAAKATKCKQSLSFFVKHFWDEIVPNELVWNWHMEEICKDIQASDELVFKRLPKLHDIIINVPPGTSKTKIISIMSTAWEFARMPEIKVFVGSYSDSAVAGISDEIKLLMKSERYLQYFPNTMIRKDRDSLHNFKTTENGEFYAYTVGGTLTSKHADILKCLPYDEIITTTIGPVSIGDIVEKKIQCKVLSFNHFTQQQEFKPILKYEKNEFRRLVEIETYRGKKLRCTEDHLVYVVGKGYTKAIDLKENDTVITN